MAQNVFELLATLKLDTSEYSEGLNNAESNTKSSGSKISAASVAMGQIAGAAIQKAASAVVDFAKSSITAGSDFDTAMSQVAATMGVTNDEISTMTVTTEGFTGTLRDFAQQLGSTTAFSATEAAEALNYMALAGYDAQTSADMLPTVLNLAAAGSIDLASASDMVTDAQSALGLSLDETTDMVDQMAAASSKSNTSVAQLGEAFLTIGATAKSLSGGTVELSTALGILANNGIKGAEGGTHLRNILLALQTPTDAAAEAMKALGVDAYDAATGEMRPLNDILNDLNASMADMTDQEKTNIIGTIFNKTDLAAANALLTDVTTTWDELSSEIENSTGAAEQMANVQLDNLAGDVTLFKSALEGAQIAISESLSPTLREFVQFGSDSLSQLTQAFKEGGAEGLISAFSDVLTNGINMITEMLPEFIQLGIELIIQLAIGIVQAIPQLIAAIPQIVTGIVNGLTNAWPQIKQAGKDLLTQLSQGSQESITDIFDLATMIITSLIEGIVNNLPQLIEEGIELVMQLLAAIDQNSATLIEGGVTLIINLIAGLIKAIPQLIAEIPQIIQAIITGFTNGSAQLSNVGQQIIQWVGNGLKSLSSSAITWGKDLIQNFISGIKQKFAALRQTVSNLAQTVKNFLGFSEPTEGPLSNFHTYAPDMMDLFASGIKDNESIISDQISKSFDIGDQITSSAKTGDSGDSGGVFNIVVQSVLDGKVIGETAYKWQKGHARAMGV